MNIRGIFRARCRDCRGHCTTEGECALNQFLGERWDWRPGARSHQPPPLARGRENETIAAGM